MSTTSHSFKRKGSTLLAAALLLPLFGSSLPAGADTANTSPLFGAPSQGVKEQRANGDRRSGKEQRSNGDQRKGNEPRNTGGYRPGGNTRNDNNGRTFGTEPRREREERRYTERQRERAPRRDYVLRELPRDHHVVHIHDRDYYVHQGHYYVHGPRGYVWVPAPVGTFVLVLPDGYISVSIGGLPYFVFGGVFYHAERGGYAVVEPPAPTPDMAAQASAHIIVNVSQLNVRSGPSFDFPVVGVVSRGDRLPVYGNAPGWRYVRMASGSYGWVSEDFITVMEEPQG